MGNRQAQVGTENAGSAKSESMARKAGKYLLDASKRAVKAVGKPLVTAAVGVTLVTGVGAKLGCSGGEEGTKNNYPCYYEKDNTGKQQCLPPTQCEEVPAPQKSEPVLADGGKSGEAGVSDGVSDAGADASAAGTPPLNEEGTMMCKLIQTPDGSVSDAGVPDAVVDSEVGDAMTDANSSCPNTSENVAQVTTTKNVKINGVECGQSKCTGVVVEGDQLYMNGSNYTVDKVGTDNFTATSGDYTLVTKMSSGNATCRVFKKNVDQGDCTDALAGSAVFMVALDTGNADALGKATVTLSTASTFSTGAETKQVVLTEGESAKTVTLGAYVEAEVSLVRGTDNKAYVAVKVTKNTNTNNMPKEPLGMPLTEGSSTSSNLSGVVYLRADLATDNTQSCRSVMASINGVDYGDGYTANINGKNYKVVINYNDSNPSKSDAALVDLTASKNTDTVMGYGKSDNVNGTTVTFDGLKVDGTSVVSSTSTPDTGATVDAGNSG